MVRASWGGMGLVGWDGGRDEGSLTQACFDAFAQNLSGAPHAHAQLFSNQLENAETCGYRVGQSDYRGTHAFVMRSLRIGWVAHLLLVRRVLVRTMCARSIQPIASSLSGRSLRIPDCIQIVSQDCTGLVGVTGRLGREWGGVGGAFVLPLVCAPMDREALCG